MSTESAIELGCILSGSVGSTRSIVIGLAFACEAESWELTLPTLDRLAAGFDMRPQYPVGLDLSLVAGDVWYGDVGWCHWSC